MNLSVLSDKRRSRDGNYEALVDGGRTWMSEELHDRTVRLAGSLAAHGIRPDDRILLLLPNSVENIVAFAAALRCGAVPIPMFIGSAASDIEAVIADCAPSGIFATPDVIARAAPHCGSMHLKIAAGGHGDLPREWLELDHLACANAALTAPVPRALTDPALICYTSGTDGRPKGVVYTHGGVHAAHRGPQRSGDATVLTALPLNTLGAWALAGRLVYRWQLILLRHFEPRAFLSAIERHRVQIVTLVPSMGEALIALPDLHRFDLSSVRRVTLTGARAAPALVERVASLFGVAPVVGYGMTEAGGGIAGTSATTKPGAVGRIAPGVQLKIVGEDGTTLAPGQTGEIHVRTPWMGTRYVGQPVKGDSAFDDGWIRTGDVGYLDADRDLFVVGRRKDIIIQAGVNVSAAEVTDVIRDLPGVRDCAVVGVPHPFLGEEVVACIVADSGITDAALIQQCSARLDPRKVPVRIEFCQSLPRTALGKVQGHELRRQLQTAGATRSESSFTRLGAAAVGAGPRRALVRDLVERDLRHVLSLRAVSDVPPVIDPATPFGDLGLDSIGAARFAHALSQTFGQPLSPVLAFSHPTIDSLSARLGALFCPDDQTASPVVNRLRREERRNEAIAIVGIGCRLPGGVDTPAEFWSLLRQGDDATADIERWNIEGWYDSTGRTPGKMYTRRAALLQSPHEFDAEFFGLSDREAASLDPQHRLLLEVTWEAIESAGYDPLRLSTVPTGLFLGISGSSISAANGLGAVPAMAVGRLCNFLDLRGPALAIDTVCSSSMTALHIAVQSLRGGECDFAVAGGVHVIGSPRTFVGLSEMGVLARDGRCKAFDERADGYGRGEGCVMIALKRLSDAEAERCPIIALIRGSAVRHDGRSSSLTAPNGRAQQEVIRAALADAAVAPTDVNYLEAHGTGTPLGDPIEIEAAMAVLGDPARVLLLGTVKTNIGHLEAAAGAAGVAKVALALHHEAIPAHLHYRSLNPMLTSRAESFRIPVTLTPWRRTNGSPRLAGVTSMGLSGTNAHVILEEAADDSPATRSHTPDESLASESASRVLLCLSARSTERLQQQARRYAEHFGTISPRELTDSCFTAAVGRTHFRHRLALLVQSPSEARQQLLAFSHAPNVAAGAVASGERRQRIALLFTGHGRQRHGMARALYDRVPVFRDAMHQCASILDGTIPVPLLDALYGDDTLKPMESMAISQPALFAVEWSLAQLWRSWGVQPEVVVGHSIGECVAACVAGVMSLEDGLRLASARGRLLESLPATGAMCAILTDEDRVQRTLEDWAHDITIAAVNSPRNVVVAGSDPAVSHLEHRLANDAIETRRLHIGRAAHSPAVEPLLGALEDVAATITFSPLLMPLVSTVTGARATPDELSHVEYWRRQMRQPVRFASAVSTVLRAGYNTFIEIGPDPVLSVLGPDCVTEPSAALQWLPSLRHDRDDLEQMYESLGELYTSGGMLNWEGVYRHTKARRIALPTYPFEKRSYRQSHEVSSAAPRGAAGAPAGVSTLDAEATRVTSAHVPGRRWRAEPLERRTTEIRDHVRRAVFDVVGDKATRCPDDQNLLQFGMDSVRVIDVVTRVGRQLDLACRPSDLIRQPTIAGFAAHLAALIESGSEAPTPTSASPLVTINERGPKPPLFCVHPSGGHATPYLRLAQLCGDAQPLYAIQSRALDQPEREHASILGMAADYATIVQCTRPGPYRLLGWSMGGVIAHAVASELERRGAVVDVVGLIDPIGLDMLQPTHPLSDLIFAVTALVHDAQREPPSPQMLRPVLSRFATDADPRALLEWCEQSGAVGAGMMTPRQFKAALDLYLHHFTLTRSHRPPVVAASLRVWWAGNGTTTVDATLLGSGSVTVTSIGGTHFSIVRPPYIDIIAADLDAAMGSAPVPSL